MQYIALASDYDGTLTERQRPSDDVLDSLRRVRASGRRLILITGRILTDLQSTGVELDLFDRLVCENGATLYDPHTRRESVLSPAHSNESIDALLEILRQRDVSPLSRGRVMIATWTPHETTVLSVIHELGLDLQIVFNRGAVMVLPPDINKASGLRAALADLGITPHNTLGIGDAENDHVFLEMCGASVAVANAIPMLQRDCDYVTEHPAGEGVLEVITALLEDDLRHIMSGSAKHLLRLGSCDGRPFSVNTCDSSILIAGPSQSGKSRVTCGILERFQESEHQFCVVDPESDYDGFPGALSLGSVGWVPDLDHVTLALSNPSNSVVVNLLALPFTERPAYLVALITAIQELRAATGRPHWLVIDEAHHMLYRLWEHFRENVPRHVSGLIMVTVNPDELSGIALSLVDTVIVCGRNADRTLKSFFDAAKIDGRELEPADLDRGQALIWTRGCSDRISLVNLLPTAHEHRRHIRKYGQGDVGSHQSFYFKGPDSRLNLQAHNLQMFAHIAKGVDDPTWLHHLRRGDYARWFRDVIKDLELTELAESLEHDHIPASESRKRIREFIEAKYTLPERAPFLV